MDIKKWYPMSGQYWDLFSLDEMPVMVDVDGDNLNQRLVAAVFPYKKGVVFADAGWASASQHPFHILDGPVEFSESRGLWEVGRARFTKLMRDSSLWEYWEEWLVECERNPRFSDPAFLKEQIAMDLSLKVKDLSKKKGK